MPHAVSLPMLYSMVNAILDLCHLRHGVDTFQLWRRTNNGSVHIPWSNENIAWNSDRFVTFGRPSTWVDTVKPHSWKLTALQRDKDAYSGDEEFLVWMRPSAFPLVTKLHRVIREGLPKGNYTIVINYG